MPKAFRSPASVNLASKRVDNYDVVPTQLMVPLNRGVGLQPGPSYIQSLEGTDAMDNLHSPSADYSSLTRFLERFIEPSSIKSESSYHYGMKYVSLALRFGPLIVRRFSHQQVEYYEVPAHGYYGLDLAVRLPMCFLVRINLALFAMRQSRQSLSFSLQWNMSFPRVIANTAPVIALARKGDISAMTDLFKTGMASPNDVQSDGTSLLHVSTCFSESSGFRLILIGCCYDQSLPTCSTSLGEGIECQYTE